MTVRLRAHHLLCLLTYAGKGYSRAFTRNYTAILQRIAAGEAIEMVAGPDDICIPLLQCSSAHCRDQQTLTNDRLAMKALKNYLHTPLIPGTVFHLSTEHVIQLRQAFAGGVIREACSSCHWQQACSVIAKQHFTGTQLWPPLPEQGDE